MNNKIEAQNELFTDKKTLRIRFSDMKSNHKETIQQSYFRNTFQNDLDCFRQLFSETKNSRLITPAKFKHYSNLIIPPHNIQEISSNLSTKYHKKQLTLQEAAHQLDITKLSSDQQSLYDYMIHDHQNQRLIQQTNKGFGKYTLIKVLALTQNSDICIITNNVEQVYKKMQGTTLQLRIVSNDQNIQNQINNQLNDVYIISIGQFNQSDIKFKTDTIFVIDLIRYRQIDTISIIKMAKNMHCYSQNNCIVFTKMLQIFQLNEIKTQFKINQIMPSQLDYFQLKDYSDHYLQFNLDNLIFCKYEQSQIKYLANFLREKINKLKRNILIVVQNKANLKKLSQQFMNQGLKTEIFSQNNINNSVQNNKGCKIMLVWQKQMNECKIEVSYVIYYGLWDNLEDYLDQIYKYENHSIVICLLSDQQYIEKRNEILLQHIQKSKIIGLLNIIFNQQLSKSNLINIDVDLDDKIKDNDLNQQLYCYKVKDIIDSLQISQPQIMKIVDYLDQIDESMQLYSVIPLQFQIFSDASIEKLVEECPFLKGAFKKGKMIGTNSIRCKTIDAAVEQQMEINHFVKQLQSLPNNTRLETKDSLIFYKKKKKVSRQEMQELGDQIYEKFNTNVFEQRKMLDIVYLFQTQFSFNSIDNMINYLKFKQQTNSGFVKEKKQLIQQYLEVEDNNQQLLQFLNQFGNNYKQKLPIKQLNIQREKSLFVQDVNDILNNHFELINLQFYNIIDNQLSLSELNNHIGYNILKIMLGKQSVQDNNQWKTLKMYGKYCDYDILDMQVSIMEIVGQFIKKNQDYEDQDDFTGRVTKKIKY